MITISAPYLIKTTSHHMLDGHHGDALLLHDIDTVKTYIRNLHGITTHEQSHILAYETGPAEMHGITAMILSPGKHSTIHTYSHTDKRTAFIDTFNSCHPLEDLEHLTIDSFHFNSSTTYTKDRTAHREEEIQYPAYTNKETYGPHLIVEGIGAENRVIDSVVLEYFISTLAQHIGMTPIYGPVSTEDNVYMSALMVIAESHIAIHYNKSTSKISLDMFSCKYFSTERCMKLLEKILFKNVLSLSLFKRGKGFY